MDIPHGVIVFYPHHDLCGAMVDALDSASHGRLPHRLQGSWRGTHASKLALRALYTVSGGYRIVDDPVVEKSYARLLGEAA